MQKSAIFLYTNNELSEREIKKTILFIIAPKIIQYKRINLMKKAKVLPIANSKTLMKELEDTNKWKDILCLWIQRINIVKICINMHTTQSNTV